MGKYSEQNIKEFFTVLNEAIKGNPQEIYNAFSLF